MTAIICEPKDAANRVAEPDRQLAAAARQALARCGYRALAEVECAVRDGVVVLSGAVPSYYLKQIAQVAVLRLPTIGYVANLIDVCHSRGDG